MWGSTSAAAAKFSALPCTPIPGPMRCRPSPFPLPPCLSARRPAISSNLLLEVAQLGQAIDLGEVAIAICRHVGSRHGLPRYRQAAICLLQDEATTTQREFFRCNGGGGGQERKSALGLPH